MKKNGKPSGLMIFVIVVAALVWLTHSTELNSVPGMNVSGGEVSVDLGDLHYHN